MSKSYNIEKTINSLIKEGVIVKNKINYKFSDEFINCIKKVNEDIQNHKRPGVSLFGRDRLSMLTFLFSEAYIDFLPPGKRFSTKGVKEKVETMVFIMM